MRRRAWSGLTIGSFILAIVLGGVWLRSYIHLDLITRRVKNELHDQEHMLAWCRGRVCVSYIHRLSDPQDVPAEVSPAVLDWDWTVESPNIIIRTGHSTVNHYGFSALAGSEYVPASEGMRAATWTKYGVVVPLWFLFGVAMVLPAVAWCRSRRRASKPAAPVAESSTQPA